MAGIEIVKDRRVSNEADIELGKELSASMIAMGVSATISARDMFSGCLRIAPLIVITDKALQWALDIMEAALNSCERCLRIEWAFSAAGENEVSPAVPVPSLRPRHLESSSTSSPTLSYSRSIDVTSI